nr:hypothetical protein [Nocardia sp. NRRL WC-3656]
MLVSALHAQQHTIVEQPWVVDAVGVGDQGVAGSGQIQQPIPGGIVTRQPRYLQRQHNPDLPQGDIGHQRLEPVTLPEHRPGHAQVGVDYPDLLARPAQRDGPFTQVILAGGGLAVTFQLGQCRLTHIHDRRSDTM